MSVGVTVVTGGAGFIGTHLVECLASAGKRVRVVEKPGTDISHLPSGIEIAFADVRDRDAIQRSLSGARHVYHLAANPNLWARDRGEFDAINHQGTVHVLDTALELGAERVLHCSTESILTTPHHRGPITEEMEPGVEDAVGPYCLSKLRAEQAARQRAAAGHPVLIASPTMPVGPGDRRLTPPSRLIRDFCSGRIPARMDCTLNLIDVRDVAQGLIRTMERGQPGRRYLLGGENLSLLQLLEALSELCQVPVPRARIPYWASLGFARLSELWADLVSGVHPRATVTGVHLAKRVMHFDTSRTHAELGLRPRPVREALADAVTWMRAHGILEIKEPQATRVEERKRVEQAGGLNR